jgi:hypothetical protein
MSSWTRSLSQRPSKNFVVTGGYTPGWVDSRLKSDFSDADIKLDNYYLYNTVAGLQAALQRVANYDCNAGSGDILEDIGKEFRIGTVGDEARLTFRLCRFITFGPNTEGFGDVQLGTPSDLVPFYFLTEVRDTTDTNIGKTTHFVPGPFNRSLYNVALSRV